VSDALYAFLIDSPQVGVGVGFAGWLAGLCAGYLVSRVVDR